MIGYTEEYVLLESTKYVVDSGDLEITFGKHKGSKFRDIPKEYLFFILTTFDGDSIWKNRAKAELERRKNIEAGADLNDAPNCIPRAVEEFSTTRLLREFIQRENKTQGISAWVSGFSREVLRHGRKCNKQTYHYLGHGFGFRVHENKKVLVGVWEIPEDGEE